MLRATVLITIIATPMASLACEMVDDPGGYRYLECDPERAKAAKAAYQAQKREEPKTKPAWAQTPEEFAANMAVVNAKNDTERAAALAKAEQERQAQEKRDAAARAKAEANFKSSGTTGQWRAILDENRMDDRPRLRLALIGNEPLPTKFRPRPPGLVVACESGKVELYVDARTHLSGPDDDLHQHRFRVKFDNEKPQQLNGGKATSHDAVFFPNAKVYLRKLRQAHKLMVEVTPYTYASATTTFNVAGLDQHLAELKKHCGI